MRAIRPPTANAPTTGKPVAIYRRGTHASNLHTKIAKIARMMITFASF